jgi:hypothetical protein
VHQHTALEIRNAALVGAAFSSGCRLWKTFRFHVSAPPPLTAWGQPLRRRQFAALDHAVDGIDRDAPFGGEFRSSDELVEKRIVQNILGHRDLACSAAQCATSGRYSEAKRGKKCANSEVLFQAI